MTLNGRPTGKGLSLCEHGVVAWRHPREDGHCSAGRSSRFHKWKINRRIFECQRHMNKVKRSVTERTYMWHRDQDQPLHVKRESVPQWCLTLCDPVDRSPPGSSVHGILQARILEWVAMPFTRGSSWPRNQTRVFCVSCIGRQILYHLSHQECTQNRQQLSREIAKSMSGLKEEKLGQE